MLPGMLELVDLLLSESIQISGEKLFMHASRCASLRGMSGLVYRSLHIYPCNVCLIQCFIGIRVHTHAVRVIPHITCINEYTSV